MSILDVAVLGGGLAGLTAAATVAAPGRAVALYEALPRLGGLCGDFELEGRVFVRACNEFGGGLADLLGELRAPVQLVRSSALLALAQGPLHLPPRLGDAGRLLAHAGGLWEAVRAARRPGARVLLDVVGADPWVRALVGFLAAAAATPPDRIPLSDLVAFPREGYAWHRPVKAVGGPQAVVQALVAVAQERGARLETGVRATVEGWDGGVFVLRVGSMEVRARHVVTSAPRWEAYPAASAEGLHYGTALLALRGELEFPGGVSTVHALPEDALERASGLGGGRFDPGCFPFILTRQLGAAPASGRTLVAFFALPACLTRFDDAQASAIGDHIVATGDRWVPGLAQALEWIHVVSPEAFQARHGLWPRGVARVAPPGTAKPDELDPATGLHHVGVSAGPPGGDGAAAAFSGRRAGRRVAAALACS